MYKYRIISILFLLLPAIACEFNASLWDKSSAKIDPDPPYVELISPAESAELIILFEPYITFNETIDQKTITSSSIAVTLGGSPVDGSLTYNSSNNSVYFRPTTLHNNLTTGNEFRRGVTYLITVTEDIKDLYGNNLIQEYTRNFTTGGVYKTSTTPLDNALNVSVNSSIRIIFSDPINTASGWSLDVTDSITTVITTYDQGSTNVDTSSQITWSPTNRTLTINNSDLPFTNLAAITVNNFQNFRAASDNAGLSESFNFSFTIEPL